MMPAHICGDYPVAVPTLIRFRRAHCNLLIEVTCIVVACATRQLRGAELLVATRHASFTA